MSDLISLDRAKSQIPNAPSTDDGVVAALIEACSNVIEIKLNRTFAAATFDEIHTVVGPTASLWVNNPPISDMTAVRTGELPALYVQCNDPTNQVQFATVDITSTAVVCKKMDNNVLVTNQTFLFTGYPTFTDLAAGINLLGNGWVATLPQQFAKWQTSDLTTNYGTRSARNVSLPLTVYWWYEAYYNCNKATGEIILPALRGIQNYRITYTGGYTEIPESVQQACAELVQISYLQRNINPLLQSESLDKYSYTRAIPVNWFDLLSPASRMALQQYKIPRLTVQGTNAKA